jgi:hypothetical protein
MKLTHYRTFSAIDIFVGIIAVAPFFRGLDGLTIVDPRAGLPRFASGQAHIPMEHVMQMLPGPIVAPGPKIVVDYWLWREVVREQPPGTAAPR